MIRKFSLTIYCPSDEDLLVLSTFFEGREQEERSPEELPQKVTRTNLDAEVADVYSTVNLGIQAHINVEAIIERAPF